jgi:hypothetical protein
MTPVPATETDAVGTVERFVWPRLRAGRAAVRRAEVAALDPVSARAASALDDAGAATVASGGRPVSPSRVAAVQRELRRLADTFGWPAPLAVGEGAAFDRAAAVALHRTMAILPADAAHDGGWHFLALVVLPDVARWRRPDGDASPVGGLGRHVFGRLWWRTQVFGADLVDPRPPLRPMTEGELHLLMGRPALVADPAVARAVARAVLSMDLAVAEREAAAAALADRVLRRAPIVCFEALDADQLEAEIDLLARAAS